MEDRDPAVDAYLDEHFPIVMIAGCSFAPSQIVRALDGPLYRTLSGELADEED